MKNKVDELHKQYEKSIVELKYDYATKLLDLVEDDEVLELYSNYNEIFSKLSTLSKDEILETPELLDASIECMENYLDNKSLSIEEYEDMTIDEIMNYIEDLINSKEISLFDIIQYLEEQ